MSSRRNIFIVIAAALLVGMLNACTPEKSALQKIQDTGKLHVVTRNAATTYYAGPHGPAGMEYDMLRAFADHLGVELVIQTSDNLKDILSKVENGEVDVAAAGLTITEERSKQVRFTTGYQTITQQLVYNVRNKRPSSIKDISKGSIEVIANSSHAERLQQLQKEHNELIWDENDKAGSTELLNLVANQVIQYTIADSNEVTLNRRYHPELRVAFDISKPQTLAWAVQHSEDNTLFDAIDGFFKEIKQSGELAHLIKRNYGHMRRYDYAGTPTYMRHVELRLPRFKQLFETAAVENELDWRLLAAVAYQESHWNPRAVSPTGVRGMMMLTKATAKYLGVEKRTDAGQSIEGGARYFKELYTKFSHIAEPDRSWLALAAYNVGPGHVRDAQEITLQRGGNPNKWTDVKESLPLLTQRKWYRNTKHGYARGHEPVRYVENIRSYYDILRWAIERETPRYAPQSILAYASPVL